MMTDEACEQKRLTKDQLASFYHDEFVESQYGQLVALLTEYDLHPDRSRPVVDIGGGIGHFAQRLLAISDCIRIYDTDPEAIKDCVSDKIAAEICDALNPRVDGNEQLVCFNLILHHLIGQTEAETKRMQMMALSHWRGKCIFIQEYCYESYIPNFSGWLIYQITKSRLLSSAAKYLSRFVPSLRANTLGVGVRFRARDEWLGLFREAGFKVIGLSPGEADTVDLPWRLLLIKAIRRDAFLLLPG